MQQLKVSQILRSLGRYAASHPRLFGEIARHALSRRLAVPLDLVRWAATLVPNGDKAPKDITVIAQPPALGLGATANLMGTELRVDAALLIDAIDATRDAVKVTFRVKDLRASVLNNLQGNLAKLLASGALNLGKPASLLNFLGPKRPPAILEAKDGLFVIDLLKVPKLAQNPRFQRALAGVTPILAIGDIYTEGDLLVIGLKANPRGLRESIAGFRGA
jgi:hypothetical protein